VSQAKKKVVRKTKVNILRIVRSEIRVGSGSDGLPTFQHKVVAILPKGQKSVTISASASYRAIHITPQFGRLGSATISPEKWAEVIRQSSIVADRFSPIELTDELKDRALQRILLLTTSPAVIQKPQDARGLSPKYDLVVFVK
jgi:hypothetical protein